MNKTLHLLSTTTWLASVFEGLPNELYVAVISMLPIVELRGGLPIAIGLGISPWIAVPLCIVANLIPIPFILWFITPIFNKLKQTKLFRPMVEKLEKKALSKSDRIQQGYFWGLLLFVGIPLPGTGAWTGALIASLLDIPPKKAFPAIALGVCLAAALMGLLSLFFKGLFF
ncbi:MAG: small multi-drug export protein [Ruminococcaceae bacterium]|nr:small multi-drug export protein [Oscillospiraceae bacterium]